MAAFNFESINQSRVFDVDTTNFVTHEKIKKGKKENSFFWSTDEMYMQDGPDHMYIVQGLQWNDLRENPDAITPCSAAIAIEDRYITVPNFQVKDVRTMLDSDAAINAIIEGHLGVSIEEYTNKFGTYHKLIWHTV